MKKTKDIEKLFDYGENIIEYIDLQSAKRPNLEQNLSSKCVNEIKSLSGSWRDFPTLEELRDTKKDIEREKL
ncbi:hypothetical protein [Arcobacter vandammei]|uniref:hypothetical protein n=1 Tax=Arcobacter vandammei TaxID=2782243 RepID=UPI0018DF7D5F|nr:hypothetical protein [Arcobacter vandammei]